MSLACEVGKGSECKCKWSVLQVFVSFGTMDIRGLFREPATWSG